MFFGNIYRTAPPKMPTCRSLRLSSRPAGMAMFPALARATVGNVIPARRDFRGRLARHRAFRAGGGSLRRSSRRREPPGTFPAAAW